MGASAGAFSGKSILPPDCITRKEKAHQRKSIGCINPWNTIKHAPFIALATEKKWVMALLSIFAISFRLSNFFTCSFYSLGYVEFIIFTVNEGKIQVLSSMG